jgi:hypothetical protein
MELHFIKSGELMRVYRFVSSIQPRFKAFSNDPTGKNLPVQFGWRPARPTSDLVVAEDFNLVTQQCARSGFCVFDSITAPEPASAASFKQWPRVSRQPYRSR